jgi:two-component system sensor histidine kinase DesK
MTVPQETTITEIGTPIGQTPAAKWSYISLIFSLFYFFPLVVNFKYYSMLDLALSGVAYIVFVWLFLLTARRVGNAAFFPIVATIVLAASVSSFHSGANTLFGYASFFSSYYFRSRYAHLFLVANLSTQLLTALVFDLMFVYYLGPSVAVTVSLYIYGMFSRKETLHFLNNQVKNEQLEQLAAIAERERIARDMHDLLGHSLSSLALKSELAEKLIAKEKYEQAKSEINQVASLARETLSEVRQAVTGLKKQSLSSGVEHLKNELEHLGFKTKAQIDLAQLPAKVESTVFMLCKEWVTNILRHSKGDSVNISLKQDEKFIHLEITDNGELKSLVPGNGIQGIKSRVAELNGTVNINHSSGVALQVQIPC